MSCTSCNAKCEHCYISYNGNLNGNEFYDMVEKLKDRYEIYINGSEPLINREYLKSYALYIIKIIKKYDIIYIGE